jgi:hypothetical protein
MFKIWLENQETPLPFPNSTVPYLVYHGTNKRPFGKFEYQKSQRHVLFSSFEVEAKGFFFSESPHDALEFGPNVVACYVNLQNPLLDPRRDKHLGIEGLSSQKEIDMMKILAPMIQKDAGGHYIDYMITKNYLQHRRRQTAREWIYDAINTGGLVWDALDNPGVVQRMQKLGYDGTFVHEPDTSLGRSIFILSPNQIRIAAWSSNPEPHWGEKDDFYTKKVDGYHQLFKPER